MRKVKKWLSLFLAAALAVSSFPGQMQTVSAAAAEGRADAVVDEVTEDGLKEATSWYTQDFEGVTDAGAIATAQDTNALKLGSDKTKYLSYDFTGINANSRGLDMAFADVDVTAEEKYIVEFDAAFTPGNNQNTDFAIKGTDFAYSGGVNDGPGSGYLLKLSVAAGSTNYKLNDAADVTIPSGEWCHYYLYVDKTKKLMSTTITGTSTAGIADKVVTAYNGEGNVAGLYMRAGRYYSIMSVDNITVRAVADGDEFGELGEETLLNAEFTSALNRSIGQPAGNDPVHLPLAIKATGSLGSDLTDQVSVKWSMVGLEKEDGYISLTKEPGTEEGTKGDAPDEKSTTAYFNVRNGVSTYFGYVKAEVSYGENQEVITTPFAVIGATGSPATQLAPQTGYYEDMNSYADSLVGYQGTANGITDQDLILNGWSIYGSNAARTLKLVEERNEDQSTTKSLEFASNGGSGSTVAVYQWVDQDSQYVIDFTAKFTADMLFGVYYNTPNNKNPNEEWSASYSGGTLTVGTESIGGIDTNKWYRFVISADPSSVQKYSVAVYDGTAKIGEVTGIDMTNSDSVQKYFCFMGTWPMYLQKFAAYKPTVENISVISGEDTVKVPEKEGETVKVSLSANLTAADGLQITGAVDWSLAEEYANVELTTTGAQTAELKVNQGASGTIKVVAVKDGKQAEKEIQLTTSSNVVSFTQSTSSITIPFDGEEAVINIFEAVTRDGNGAILEGSKITYSLLASDRATPAVVKGVTFEDGVLVVEAGASSAVVYVKAQNEEGLVVMTQVSIHGLAFSFGSSEKDGYAQVKDNTLYTERLGYGLNTTDNLTMDADSITGSKEYRFKVNVPNGNYTVALDVDMTKVPYDKIVNSDGTTTEVQRKVKSETVESVSAATGIEKATNSKFGLDPFSVAVCDGVLDLTFPENAVVKTVSISQIAAKSARSKPMVYAIGDSTTANTGNGAKSWGNCVVDKDVALPDTFGGFANHGMAGRNSVSFYNEARVEAVLLNVCPGDYVTVNMGINSQEGEAAAYPVLLREYYVDGIIQRGGIPVIVTATPDGPVGNNLAADYDASTGKFTNNRGNGARNDELRKIATEKGLHLIELGQAGEDWMNTLTMDDVNAYNTANGASFTTVLEMVQSWYVDHNHYKQYLGIWIGNYLLGELEKLELKTAEDLQKLYDQVKDYKEPDYRSGWSDFKTALDAATAMVSNTAATQSEITAAYKALNNAANALVKIDRATLQALYERTKIYKQKDYEETGWSDFQAALSMAGAVLEKSDAADADIVKAYHALSNAAGVLVKKETDQEPPKPTVFKITYNLNKGKNHTSNPSTYTSDDQNITLKNPTRKGYTFAGWYTDSKFKTKITKIDTSKGQDYTLYAKWTKVSVGTVTLKSVKNSKSKQMVVTLKKKVSGVDGYEVEYSTEKKFKKATTKKATIKKSATSCTIKKLKKGKTYYVRVRAYKNDSTGAKVYSSKYSKVLNVKIKK